MTFELTDELESNIHSALENQEKKFLVDAAANKLVECGLQFVDDEENYYSLPEWNSAEGFKMREDFVRTLHAPEAREKLQMVLHSGRGVFKNFKETIRLYPEIEKRWHRWKNKCMHVYIITWYNALREVWGLEQLGEIPEDEDDLIASDFVFAEYDNDIDKELIMSSFGAEMDTLYNDFPSDIQHAISELWLRQFRSGVHENHTGFVCRSIDGEFAGCITTAKISKNTETSMILTSFFVPLAFRGLGLGSKLFSLCMDDLKKRGKKLILIANTIVPENLSPMLARAGFAKTGSGFAARL